MKRVINKRVILLITIIWCAMALHTPLYAQVGYIDQADSSTMWTNLRLM